MNVNESATTRTTRMEINRKDYKKRLEDKAPTPKVQEVKVKEYKSGDISKELSKDASLHVYHRLKALVDKRDNRTRPRKLSRDARDRLAELRFDPMEKSISLHDQAQCLLLEEFAKERPSGVKVAAYLGVMAKVLTDIMAYGYGKQPVLNEVETVEDYEMVINVVDISKEPETDADKSP